MMDVLVQLEESGLGTWVRESNSLLAYPSILFLHTLGMALLAGVSGLIDLRILGVGSEIPLDAIQKYVPYMWAGFWVNAVTGIALFIADATTKAISPVFYTKLGFIVIAMVITSLIKRRIFVDPLASKRPVPMNTRLLALVSIFCWLGAITAGRLLAYVGPGTAAALR
jgi:hypothetical protein